LLTDNYLTAGESTAGVVVSVVLDSLQATKEAAMNAIAKNFFILLFV